MKTKRNNNVLLILACVLSYLTVALSIVVAVCLAFNIAGLADLYERLLLAYIVENVDISGQVTMYIVELGLGALMNLYLVNIIGKTWQKRPTAYIKS